MIKRNPHYWKMGEDGQPLPYLDEVRFPVIPDDATRILKLQAGEVDGAELIPYARVAELKNDAEPDMELFQSTKVQFITVNVRPTLKNGEKNVLSDPKVRQALNYAIDKNAIGKIVTFGVGTPLVSFMSSTTPMAINNGRVYPYDAEKAKALLKEAGVAEGTEVTSIGLAGAPTRPPSSRPSSRCGRRSASSCTIEQLDNATRTARYRDGDFQMRRLAMDQRHQRPEPDHVVLRLLPQHRIAAQRLSGQADRRVVRASRSRRWTRRSAPCMYKEIQDTYVAAAPIMFLYESPYPVALRKQVKGFVQIPLGNNIFSGAYVEK